MNENNEKLIESSSPQKYILYGFRWILFILIVSVAVVNGMTFTLFTIISTKSSEAYKISLTLLSVNSFFIMLMYPVANILISNVVYQKYGLRITIFVGFICLLICQWLRTLINTKYNAHFIMIMASGFFAGIAQPFIMNCYSEICSNWFSTGERIFVNGIWAISGPVGGALGMAYPLFFIGDVTSMKDDVFKKKLQSAFLFFAFICSIIIGGSLILFKEKPNTPPTKSAEISQKNNDNISEACGQLFKNCNFLIEAFIFTFYYGTISIVSICVQMIVDQFGISSSEAAFVGAFFTGSGLISAFVVSFLLSRTNKYKFFTILVSLVATTGFCFVIYFSYTKQILILDLFSVLFGVGVLPIVSISYQFGCEVAYPVSATMVSGFQLSLSQAYAIIVSLSITLILPSKGSPKDKGKGLLCGFIIIAGMVLGLILSIIVKEDLRRTRVDKEEKVSIEVATITKSEI